MSRTDLSTSGVLSPAGRLGVQCWFMDPFSAEVSLDAWNCYLRLGWAGLGERARG